MALVLTGDIPQRARFIELLRRIRFKGLDNAIELELLITSFGYCEYIDTDMFIKRLLSIVAKNKSWPESREDVIYLIFVMIDCLIPDSNEQSTLIREAVSALENAGSNKTAILDAYAQFNDYKKRAV